MRFDPALEIKQVLAHYDLGELVAYEKNDRGYVNTSYSIETDGKTGRHRYFLRKYKAGIKEEELKFEHSTIHHLIANRFDLVAHIFSTRDGESYIEVCKYEADQRVCEYYAIFEFLKGEDKYTWINPVCSPAEIMNAASVLARYHAAVHGFVPEGRRTEPKIIDLLPQIPESLDQFLRMGKQTQFDAYLNENQQLIINLVERTLGILKNQDPQEIVQLVIHCDYHPGNLKFDNSQVIGLFDFDWSKMDARCFDVALALKYFFSNWQMESDGELRLDDIAVFLRAYQQTLDETIGLERMNQAELSLLPHMILASALYILYWTILDYYPNDVDELEYLGYLKHCLNIMKWLDDENNWSNLQRTINST
jgi:homoserine kinase type II